MTTYSEKLKSPKWQRKRLEILQRDNFTCCKCGDTETELHVHHIKYTGEPYDAPNEDLETLCKYCHSIIEYFKLIIARDGLVSLVRFDTKFVLSTKLGFILLNIKSDQVDLENYFSFKNDNEMIKHIFNLSNNG